MLDSADWGRSLSLVFAAALAAMTASACSSSSGAPDAASSDAAVDRMADDSGATLHDGGSAADAPAADAPAADALPADGATVFGACTIDGGECPPGYECACGGPGVGQCQCHKQCQSANDCDPANRMCGCGASGSAPGLCVSDCFCYCD